MIRKTAEAATLSSQLETLKREQHKRQKELGALQGQIREAETAFRGKSGQVAATLFVHVENDDNDEPSAFAHVLSNTGQAKRRCKHPLVST